VVKIVSDFRQVGGFLRVLRFDENKNTDTHKQAYLTVLHGKIEHYFKNIIFV
jgi:hypothetical protein